MAGIKKAAVICCSNGQNRKYYEKITELEQVLDNLGIEVVFSSYIYADENGYCGTAAQRAESLMGFYKDDSVDALFDISGGDLANEILHLLDYEVIKASKKSFWGYSDLTTIINAIYAKTGKSSVLYQVRNLVYKDQEQQAKRFAATINHGKEDLYDIEYTFLQGEKMSGTVVGGNIRCLLKLAGTEYWPDLQDKILLLESYSGNVPRMAAYFSQLKQMGVFEKVQGVLLGTFTEMESQGYSPNVWELLREYIDENLPVAVTREIGHGTDSKAIVIGEQLVLKNKVSKSKRSANLVENVLNQCPYLNDIR